MSKMNQKEAVFSAVNNVLAENNISFDAGTDAKTLITKALRASIVDVVVAGFKSGEVELSAEAATKFDTDQKLKTYTSGLVTNWLNKDKRLNGGMAYVAKNPGSRAGSGDPQLKALKALITQVDETARPEIQAAIDARIAEIKPASAAKEVDYSALPESIRNKFAPTSQE